MFLFRQVICAAALSLAGSGVAAQSSAPAPERLHLPGLYEPSGIVQLSDGRLLIVEDEKEVPFTLLTATDRQAFSTQPLRLISFLMELSGISPISVLDDLEAVTIAADGYVYAITSHSRTQAGNRKQRRELLVRFRVNGERATDIDTITSLRGAITAVNTELDRAGRARENNLNIEGLAYDNAGNRLLIGLRQPVIDGLSAILALPNPDSAFSENEAEMLKLILLDLDGEGIRALAFDPLLNGFLIISRREEKDADFSLWCWSGAENQAPRRARIEGQPDLSRAEGLAFINYDGTANIMIVFDNGRKSRGRLAEFLLFSHDLLKVE